MVEGPERAGRQELAGRPVSELSISVTVPQLGDGPCTVIQVVGEADLTTGSLREVLTAEAAKKPSLLLVDLRALQFIDSGALRMITIAYQQLRRDGGTLALVHPASVVARVLQVMGIDQLIPVYDSVDEAIAATRSA
jgi:anti-sigma B factor antagonist